MPDTYDPLSDIEPEAYILDPTKPLVLLLGWVDHEGILSSLKTTGRQYKRKLLESSPENWDSISALFNHFKVSSVLGKFSENVLYLLMHPEYSAVRDRLFRLIGSVPNQVFIYEDLLQGEQTDNFREELGKPPSQGVYDGAFDFLRTCHVELVPYKRRADVTVLAESFLDDTERNLIFRLYIPSRRLWSSEADKFLQLFQEYIAKVDRLAVRLEQKRTDFGTIYEFHGEPPSGEHDLTSEFQDFSKLMDICAADSDAAASLLMSKNLDAREVTKILERYSKEARRLQFDIKHDLEGKTISIRHRLESEFIDFNPSPEDWQAIASLVNLVVPGLAGGLFLPSVSFGGLPATSSTTGITYNIRPQFISMVNGIVAEEIHGNQHFSPEHHRLLELVRTHGGADTKQLETAVYEVADNGVEQVDRLKAKQRLKGFPIAIGKKTGDVAFSVLQKYIEGQLGD
jgi:hypothetical protein